MISPVECRAIIFEHQIHARKFRCCFGRSSFEKLELLARVRHDSDTFLGSRKDTHFLSLKLCQRYTPPINFVLLSSSILPSYTLHHFLPSHPIETPSRNFLFRFSVRNVPVDLQYSPSIPELMKWRPFDSDILYKDIRRSSQKSRRRSISTTLVGLGTFFLLCLLFLYPRASAFLPARNIYPITRNVERPSPLTAKSPLHFFGSSEMAHGTSPKGSTRLYFSRREDNLFSGLAEIGIGCSIGVLWSEYSVIMSGCGPLHFSDTLERICYQGVLALSSVALFNRIVTRKSLEAIVDELFGPLLNLTLVQVRIAEYASGLAVLGAILALAVQHQSGAKMDGLSGIDISLCRAIRDL
jgi:hypothetical protein